MDPRLLGPFPLPRLFMACPEEAEEAAEEEEEEEEAGWLFPTSPEGR